MCPILLQGKWDTNTNVFSVWKYTEEQSHLSTCSWYLHVITFSPKQSGANHAKLHWNLYPVILPRFSFTVCITTVKLRKCAVPTVALTAWKYCKVSLWCEIASGVCRDISSDTSSSLPRRKIKVAERTPTHWIMALLQQYHVLEEGVMASCAPSSPLPVQRRRCQVRGQVGSGQERRGQRNALL